jgi:hypothetical protein
MYLAMMELYGIVDGTILKPTENTVDTWLAI